MSEIPGEAPARTYTEETARPDKIIQPDIKEFSEDETPEDESLQNESSQNESLTDEDNSDLPSQFIVRRVRTETEETAARPSKDRGLMYSLLDTLRFISLGLVIGILLVVFVVQRNDVFGPSMEPTLQENNAVFVEMISKYFTPPARGSIVTINATGLTGYNKTEKIIKRIIGLPGETVTIKDGSVYINGNLLDEPYLADNVPTYINENGVADGYDNITLGPDQYYVMGDNRGASLDSRVLGPISISRIKAHVLARIYPFNEIGLL